MARRLLDVYKRQYIGREHLLLGLLSEGSGVAFTVMQKNDVSAEKVRELLVKTVGKGIRSVLTPSDITPRCKRILELSLMQARMGGTPLAGTEHILMNLLKENESYGVRFLKQLNVDPEMVARQIGDFAQTCGCLLYTSLHLHKIDDNLPPNNGRV